MSNEVSRSVKVLFGLKIRRLRKSRGLTQEEFAHLADLDRSYIGGVERGDRNISLVNIQKLAIALNLPLSELFRDLE